MKATPRVFVVEDDHSYETILGRVLRSIDPEMHIDWAKTGESATSRLKDAVMRNESYDLIIADIFLKGHTTGIELWDRCQNWFPEVPVLIVSGLPLPSFFKAIGSNAVAPPYLEKPFAMGEARQLIESLLAGRARHAVG